MNELEIKNKAKALIMARDKIEEPQAHKKIQAASMGLGISYVDMAMAVVLLAENVWKQDIGGRDEKT